MEIVETGSRQTEVSDQAAIYIERPDPYLELATSMRSKLETLYPLYGQCTIHRIPERLRQIDEKMYKPRVVSIGPIHHGREELKAMEEWKQRYLKIFLGQTEVSLEDFIKVFKEKERELRSSYEETIGLNSVDFVRMVLVDAAFIIGVIITNSVEEYFINFDRLDDSPYKILDVVNDMYMLENQLPFFILVDIFTLANINITSEKNERISLLKITHEFTKYFSPRWAGGNLEEKDFLKVKHLVDFVRICMLPSKLKLEKKTGILTAPSAIKLHQAGVKFKLKSTTNLFEISFTKWDIGNSSNQNN